MQYQYMCPECGTKRSEEERIRYGWICEMCGYHIKNGFIKLDEVGNVVTESVASLRSADSGVGDAGSQIGMGVDAGYMTDRYGDRVIEDSSPVPPKPFVIALVALAVAAVIFTFFTLNSRKPSPLSASVSASAVGQTSNSTTQAQTEAEDVSSPEISGEWVDTLGEQSYINIESFEDNEYRMVIYSTSDLLDGTEWQLVTSWDAEKNSYVYNNCKKIEKRASSESLEEMTIYENGSGNFFVNSGKLYWTDDQENAGARCVFQSRDDVDSTLFHEIRDTAKAAPITVALLGYTPNLSGTNYVKASVSMSTASSHITQKGYDNTTSMLFDGDDKTSWQEGVTGYGIGENITVYLNREYGIRYLAFRLGNWRDDHFYDGNCRPKEMTIIIGDSYREKVTFADVKAEQWLELSREVPASELRYVIDDVYVGGRWEDTCINEIGIYGRQR